MKIRIATIEDALAIARVHIETWRTTYKGMIPQDFLDKLDYKKSGGRWKEMLFRGNKDQRIYVAENHEKRIIGFVYGGLRRDKHKKYDCEIYALYVLKRYQDRGLGKALFIKAAKWLKKKGHRSMMLWVLKENPATNFYRKLGGHRMGHKTTKIGGAMIEGVSYGWPDLQKIVVPRCKSRSNP